MNHKGTVTIETPRLLLRRFTLADSEAAFRNWTGDDRVTEFLRWPTHGSVEVTREILQTWAEGYQKDDFYQWAIVPKALGEPIGAISVVEQNEALGSVDIGYCIGSRWWHQGYTSEALGAVIPFFFDQVGANRIESQHDPLNPNSGKVMAKCGMKLEGILRRADVSNRGIVDAAIYGILAEEYGKPGETGVNWDELYRRAAERRNPRVVSPFIEAGGVAAAILTADCNIYTGVCMDTSCSLGVCAERNAIMNMITNGEQRVAALVCVMGDGSVGSPCGACRELLMHLDSTSPELQILVRRQPEEVLQLKELVPDWWGTSRFART